MTTNPLVPVPAAEPIVQAVPRARPSNAEIGAWTLIGGLILYVLMMRVVAALIGGLALYLILDRLAQSLEKRIPGMAARTTAVILVTLIGGGLIVGALGFSISFLQHHVDTLPAMMQQMADILDRRREHQRGDRPVAESARRGCARRRRDVQHRIAARLHGDASRNRRLLSPHRAS
ncbi:MAG: hypothetical protein DMF59_14735 [Acidobacteria bacterium]|nr:MAG: hypothetical protein DMF59_14735 [Acidobacteriota bacterium]